MKHSKKYFTPKKEKRKSQTPVDLCGCVALITIFHY